MQLVVVIALVADRAFFTLRKFSARALAVFMPRGSKMRF